jgi:cytochrome c oxidase subunit 4
MSSTAERLPTEANPGGNAPTHHSVNYYGVFGLLVVLTAVTVGVGFIHLPNEAAKWIVALLIASIKGTAVAMYFMHLKFEGKLIYIILLVPLALVVLLIAALFPDIVMSRTIVDTP